MQPYLAPFYQEFVEKYPFDFVIGSVHSIWRRDIAAGSVFEGRTDEEVYRATLEETLEDVRLHESFDVLGHLDYMTRYGSGREQEYSYRRYQHLIDEILKTLISQRKRSGIKYRGIEVWPSLRTSSSGCTETLPGIRWRDSYRGGRWSQTRTYCL